MLGTILAAESAWTNLHLHRNAKRIHKQTTSRGVPYSLLYPSY